MSDVPYMPEAAARYFADVVKFTTCKAHDTWGHVFEFRDLEQECWAIALQRWQGWGDQKAFARNDLKFHLRKWIERQLSARGWKRIRTEDKRRWVPTASERSYDPHIMAVVDNSSPWAVESDEDCELRLTADWAPMGRGKRERYARILMHRYPVLASEFEGLEAMPKPSNLSHSEYERRKERSRAKLRVKYATELATARYEVEGFKGRRAA